MKNIETKDGRVVRVYDENGEVEWTEEDSVRRDKISQKSKEELHKHLKKGEFKKYAKKTFEILTGETVEEFEADN